MPNYICKLSDGFRPFYFEWSTIVDAPVTYGMLREDFIAYYLRRYGETSKTDLDIRLSRVEATGTSCMDQTLDEVLSCNRAGPKETHADRAQLLQLLVGHVTTRPPSNGNNT